MMMPAWAAMYDVSAQCTSESESVNLDSVRTYLQRRLISAVTWLDFSCPPIYTIQCVQNPECNAPIFNLC
jgi:hypothetical protein